MKRMSCPTGKPGQCQDPLDRFLACKVCKDCPREDIKKINELVKKAGW
jgi:hypothetical protein